MIRLDESWVAVPLMSTSLTSDFSVAQPSKPFKGETMKLIDEEGETKTKPQEETRAVIEEKTPSLYRYRLDFKIYPFKCPCCKETITAPPNAVFMNPPFAVGVTKVAYGKKKKKRATKTQATLQGTESY